jgi:hypothetical protein
MFLFLIYFFSKVTTVSFVPTEVGQVIDVVDPYETVPFMVRSGEKIR